MYKFVDTTEASDGAFLPSEALRINGTYIEDVVPGYRTLTVSGREALSPELDVHDTVTRDGAILKARRYPARVIKVQYQIVAENAESYRTAYNKLAQVLDVENAQLIFNDESDKFLTGTPSYIGEVEPGRNCVVGEFEIYCADPFKYSLTEYEVEAQDVEIEDESGEVVVNKMFVADYNGTYKAFPTITTEFYKEVGELTGKGDCGYVAFIKNDGGIIQIGDPEEINGEQVEVSETLIYDEFDTLTESWFSGISLSPVLGDASGTIKASNGVLVPEYPKESEAAHIGASATQIIPADQSGELGATDFVVSFFPTLRGSSSTYAKIRMSLLTGSVYDKKVFADVLFSVSGATGTSVTCGVSADINTSIPSQETGRRSLYSNASVYYAAGTTTVTKEGNVVTFNHKNVKETFYCKDAEDIAVTGICFEFYMQKNKSKPTTNSVDVVKFVKNNCLSFLDVPNKFTTGDVLEADCRNAEIILNGLRSPEYGALGNEWEKFFLKSGENRISVSYSDWLTGEYVPTFKMRYREVFL